MRRLFKISRWIRTALLPFKNPIANAMLNLCGTLSRVLKNKHQAVSQDVQRFGKRSIFRNM
jgi:hypothetical protein